MFTFRKPISRAGDALGCMNGSRGLNERFLKLLFRNRCVPRMLVEERHDWNEARGSIQLGSKQKQPVESPTSTISTHLSD